jgi:hypothetical protein
MATLQWDKVGERIFRTGIDRGVLYIGDKAVVWNGLTSVEEQSDREVKSYYLDGWKYLQTQTPGDYLAKLKAFTYPDEFEKAAGVNSLDSGLSYYEQPPVSFDLTYRTRLGNDVDGTDYGYKIHIIYNVMATTDPYAYETLSNSPKPIEFTWTLSGTPPPLEGYRPTSHISIDSTKVDPAVLQTVEDALYGSAINNPYLPSIDEITDLLEQFGSLVIVDNGDGTWTAIDLADDYITMDSSTRFTIRNADATYLDTVTYNISTTNPE